MLPTTVNGMAGVFYNWSTPYFLIPTLPKLLQCPPNTTILQLVYHALFLSNRYTDMFTITLVHLLQQNKFSSLFTRFFAPFHRFLLHFTIFHHFSPPLHLPFPSLTPKVYGSRMFQCINPCRMTMARVAKYILTLPKFTT